MVWLLSILLYVHVLGAILWFGSTVTLHFVLMPSVAGMPYETQHSWFLALRTNYSRIIGPIAGLTVLFGILRGIAAGVLGSLSTPYGITFAAAFLLAIPLIVVGTRFTGATAEKLATAATGDEVRALSAKMGRYGRIEAGLMLVILALMIAMHAGY